MAVNTPDVRRCDNIGLAQRFVEGVVMRKLSTLLGDTVPRSQRYPGSRGQGRKIAAANLSNRIAQISGA
jgi:hypothetical protein